MESFLVVLGEEEEVFFLGVDVQWGFFLRWLCALFLDGDFREDTVEAESERARFLEALFFMGVLFHSSSELSCK